MTYLRNLLAGENLHLLRHLCGLWLRGGMWAASVGWGQKEREMRGELIGGRGLCTGEGGGVTAPNVGGEGNHMCLFATDARRI